MVIQLAKVYHKFNKMRRRKHETGSPHFWRETRIFPATGMKSNLDLEIEASAEGLLVCVDVEVVDAQAQGSRDGETIAEVIASWRTGILRSAIATSTRDETSAIKWLHRRRSCSRPPCRQWRGRPWRSRKRVIMCWRQKNHFVRK